MKKRTIFLTSNTSWYLYNFRKSTIVSLIDNGYHPICLAPLDKYSEKLVKLGAEFVELDIEGKSTNPFKELFSIIQVIKILRKYKPDFVYNFTIKMNIYVGICSHLFNIPFANNVSGLGTTFLHKGIAYTLAKFLYGFSNKLSKKVFFQNIDDRDLFIKLNMVNQNKVQVLPGSGVDIHELSFKGLNLESEGRTFLMIARVIADKGVAEYIEAANLVKEQYPETQFLLVGDWNISNKSAFNISTIENWKKNSSVQFLGHQDDVRSWIYKSDILVLPSYREGMPRTVLEAASCGRPAIVTDVPGCRQSIENNVTGWLCTVKSAEDLAKKMIACIEMNSVELEEYGKRARDRIEDSFSDRIVIQHYLDLL